MRGGSSDGVWIWQGVRSIVAKGSEIAGVGWQRFPASKVKRLRRSFDYLWTVIEPRFSLSNWVTVISTLLSNSFPHIVLIHDRKTFRMTVARESIK